MPNSLYASTYAGYAAAGARKVWGARKGDKGCGPASSAISLTEIDVEDAHWSGRGRRWEEYAVSRPHQVGDILHSCSLA